MLHTKIAQDQATAVQAKPKILIISSYRRPCGIAQYVEFLEGPLRAQPDFDLDIAALPVDLFRANGPYARKAAEQIMAEILEKSRQADVVNIQLEPGLFGLTPFDIWKRLNAIIKASKKIVVTYHTVPPMASSRPQLSLRGLKEYIQAQRGNYVFDRFFKAVRSNPGKFRHLVQTRREAKNFALLGIPEHTISAAPLSFISREDRANLSVSDQRAWLNESYPLEGKIVIGCFGFLSAYKGIETAVKAMRNLPEDYHLLIVGGLHPEGVAKHTVKQPYVQQLLAEIEPTRTRKGLTDRVHFCGALNNEDFNRVMAGCDAIVLPYAEVGQTSSGPAALALDMQKPVYCSRTHCFKELEKFQPGLLSFFEIGNHIELAQKLQRRESEMDDRVEARQKYLAAHNVENRARLYANAAQALLAAD